MIVGSALVTMRINPSERYSFEYVAEPGLEGLLKPLGLASIFCAPHEEFSADHLDQVNPRIIVLSGGNDLSVISGREIDRIRDSFEGSLLKYAKQRGIPALGICRGFQFMNVSSGGSVVPVTNHVGVTHSIYLQGRAPQEFHTVNSFHNYGIKPSGLAGEFKPLAYATDGTVEAAVNEVDRFLGVMWHPERENGQREKTVEAVRRLCQP